MNHDVKNRNYFEIYLLLLAAGFAVTSTAKNNLEVTSTMPTWVRFGWLSGLALGSLVAVVGEALFTDASLLIERAALFFLAGLVVAYTAAFVVIGVATSTISHILYVGIALLAFAAIIVDRGRQIQNGINGKKRVFQRLPTGT